MLLQGKRCAISARALWTASAVCAVATPVGVASAEIVYSGAMNIVAPATSSGVFINLETGAVGGGSAPTPAGWDINLWGTAANSLSFYSGGSGTVYMRSPGVVTGTNAGSLAEGTVIGLGGSFATSPNASFASNVAGHWDYGDINLVGFKFQSSSGFRYGWMRVLVGANATQRTIVDWAYESSGGSIVAGATIVPAPGALALLGVGMAAPMGRRRRR
jgi:hypothetical protein